MSDHTFDDVSPRDPFADWDAAYVLGALSPADRRAFEDHLATCAPCATGLREFAGVPGLLGALDRDEAFALLAEAEPATPLPEAPDLMPSLLHHVRRRRWRRRWTFAGAVVAAAAIAAVLALVLPATIGAPPAPTLATTLQQVQPEYGALKGLTAKVTLTTKQWGTSVDMVCRWDAAGTRSAGAATQRNEYSLWIKTADGKESQVATWKAGEGDVVRTTSATSIPIADIARIELAGPTGNLLLAANVNGRTSGPGM